MSRRCPLPSLLCAIMIATAPWLAGCATISTMPDLGSYDHPTIFSGTRLDFNALTGDVQDLRKFGSAPPDSPLLDLPFSLILDLIILPVTFPLAAYVLVFD